MSDILSLEAAREHLRIGNEISDTSLNDMITAAEATVADYLGRPLIDADLGWENVAALPANVVHAIKVVLTWLHEDRADLLSEMLAVRSLIGRYVIVTSA